MELYMFLKLPRHSLSWRGAITLPLLGEKAWQKLVKENREGGRQKMQLIYSKRSWALPWLIISRKGRTSGMTIMHKYVKNKIITNMLVLKTCWRMGCTRGSHGPCPSSQIIVRHTGNQGRWSRKRDWEEIYEPDLITPLISIETMSKCID